MLRNFINIPSAYAKLCTFRFRAAKLIVHKLQVKAGPGSRCVDVDHARCRLPSAVCRWGMASGAHGWCCGWVEQVDAQAFCVGLRELCTPPENKPHNAGDVSRRPAIKWRGQ